MVMKFPEGMVVGDIPASCRPATKGGSRKTPSKSGAAAAGGAAAAAASPLSPGVLPLTRDNLDKIRQRLEENLLSDTGWNYCLEAEALFSNPSSLHCCLGPPSQHRRQAA